MKKKYRVREGSIAWAVQEYGKPFAVLMTIGLIICLFVYFAEAQAEAKPIEEPAEPVAIVLDELPEPETWDVPLEKDLQLFIADLCEEMSIEPELVLAIIENESQWNPEAVGDGGRSFGLMQVQRWCHKDRMNRLGCDDLLNPYENVVVGIDILSEKLEKYGDVEKALCAYNAGDAGAERLYFSKGIYSSEYSRKVVERCQELKCNQCK